MSVDSINWDAPWTVLACRVLWAVSQRRWALIRYPSSVGSEESVS